MTEAQYAWSKGSYYRWLLMGGHLHALRKLLGVEIFLLLVLLLLSMGLLGPLWRHVGLALQGITVLEDLGARDAVELQQEAVPFKEAQKLSRCSF